MKKINFLKFRRPCLNMKTLVFALAILAVIGFVLAIFFGIKAVNLKKEFTEIGPREKLDKIQSYVLVLEKFEEFKKKEGGGNTTADLERAVLATNSGVLKSLFDDMVFGGNLKADMDYFLDAIIDALKLFSK